LAYVVASLLFGLLTVERWFTVGRRGQERLTVATVTRRCAHLRPAFFMPILKVTVLACATLHWNPSGEALFRIPSVWQGRERRVRPRIAGNGRAATPRRRSGLAFTPPVKDSCGGEPSRWLEATPREALPYLSDAVASVLGGESSSASALFGRGHAGKKSRRAAPAGLWSVAPPIFTFAAVVP
jgi:hypothetical protein